MSKRSNSPLAGIALVLSFRIRIKSTAVRKERIKTPIAQMHTDHPEIPALGAISAFDLTGGI